MLRCPPDKSLATLLRLADEAESYYYIAGKKEKPDGSYRILMDVRYPLKTIHGRIQGMILKTVQFPEYLQGGIKKRGQGSNAARHTSRRHLITEDIENFFPATTSKVIFEVWHRFFRFPPDVAECLTKLTTKDNGLPQGSKTSPLLANIVFWQAEAQLVAELAANGIVYTRLVDDITCSSVKDLSRDKQAWVIKKVRALVSSQGFNLKRGKETIAGAGDRMVTTKLVVNVRVALPSEARSNIRAAVNSCGNLKDDEAGQKMVNRVSGQISYLTQYHSAEGKALREKLNPIRERVLGQLK